MDRRARVVGMMVFVMGVVLLVVVFAAAYRMFSAPTDKLLAHSSDSALTATDLGSSFVSLLARIGLLFIMTIAGSLVAGKGIHLYLSGTQPKPVG